MPLTLSALLRYPWARYQTPPNDRALLITLPITKGEKNNIKKKTLESNNMHIYVRVRARACKLKATVIPTLHTPIAAKPPTIRGLRPNFSMVKHCRQRRIQRSKHIKVTIVVSSHKDRKGISPNASSSAKHKNKALTPVFWIYGVKYNIEVGVSTRLMFTC